MEKSEADVGVSDGSDYFGDLRGAGAAKRAGGKNDAGRAEQTHERLSFRVVPSIPTPEPPVPPLAAQFFRGRLAPTAPCFARHTAAHFLWGKSRP